MKNEIKIIENKKPFLIDVPVSIKIWIRTECQRRQFDIIKQARPSILYVTSDGGRNEKEWNAINENRRLYDEKVDWNCTIYKLYMDENLGMYGMGKKCNNLIWSTTDRCILLEDDIIPSVSFFRYCEELLEKYKDDQRIECICGMNHLGKCENVESDYFFSRQGSIWGIATWKRVIEERQKHGFEYSNDQYIMGLLKQRTKRNTRLSRKNRGMLKMEIGGYIEFERYSGKMLHEGAVALNYARNALLYLCKAKGIKKIAIPKFLCDSVGGVCGKNGIECRYYSITNEFTPKKITIGSDEWIYIVNYYGQISNERIKELKKKYGRIIVDNVQAYFQNPVDGVDTIYTCRKFFGVPDGAFLYTDKLLDDELPQDESFEKIHYLLGRFERTASEFYSEYTSQEKSAENEPIKRMSKLTENLLRGIDYEYVKKQRTDNFGLLHSEFEGINRLKLTVPEGAFMYPLYIENGAEIRKRLQAEKIYIPTLWPDVFDICKESEPEYDMAKNILPLPVDQRYGFAEVNYVISKIKTAL